MRAILEVVLLVLDMYYYIVIASVIFSWLYAFNVVNSGNQIVGAIGNFLYQATEPLLKRIRRFMPDLGTIDITPIVLLLGIYLVRRVIVLYIYPAVY